MKERLARILSEKGVRMSIGGCGCCGSPWVTVVVDGEVIVDDKEEFKFDNTEKKDG